MKKSTNLTSLLIFLLIFMSYSCKKELSEIKTDLNSQQSVGNAPLKHFAESLAKLVAEEPKVRGFLKSKALLKFDNDFDILVQDIADKLVDSETSFIDLLLKHSKDKEATLREISENPLLTIFIPTLPQFNPESWNTQEEIPLIAVSMDDQKEININDENGIRFSGIKNKIPAFPVMVAKINERLTLNPDHKLASSKNFYMERNGNSFYFSDSIYNNSSYSLHSENRQYTGWDPGDPHVPLDVMMAYNLDRFNPQENIWHRDYVYYGLSPYNTTSGEFKTNHVESIRAIKFVSPNDYQIISDQTGDPALNEVILNMANSAWTDGIFEFRVDVLVNSRNGIGNIISKVFTAPASELFDVQYSQYSIFFYQVSSITPKQLNLNVPIVGWDLFNYGSTWKFTLSEFDPSEVITRSFTNTTTFSGNFEISAAIKKLGLKFGTSVTSTNTSTFSTVTNLSSDFLGEAVLNFYDKILISITPHPSGNPFLPATHNTYEISTGVVKLSVEPVQVY